MTRYSAALGRDPLNVQAVGGNTSVRNTPHHGCGVSAGAAELIALHS
ncbi:MAG: hypothetical protein ACTSP2_07025 [Alphaproteobacteria bacterium]